MNAAGRISNRVLIAAARIVESWCGAAAWLDRRRYARRTKAMHGPAMKHIAWPQRGTCQGDSTCAVVTFTGPAGDTRAVVPCKRHCDDCRHTPDGDVLCPLHDDDHAWPADMQRRTAP